LTRPHRAVALLVVSMVGLGLLAPPTVAAPGPTLDLIATSSHVHAYRYGSGAVDLDLGVYLAAAGGPLEIRVARETYVAPIEAWQVLVGGATRDIPIEMIRDWWGFEDFATLRIWRDGQEIRSRVMDWCPGWDAPERVTDDGPRDPTYPALCWANPFIRGAVWGIDEGWAAPIRSGTRVKLPEGEYTAGIEITQPWRDLLEIAQEDATVQVDLTVEDQGGIIFADEGEATRARAGTQRVTATAAPIDTDPDPATISDLVALPAYGVHVDRRRQRDVLTFAADVWNAGPAPLTVEGFRTEGEDIMEAFQYFTQDGEVVARAPVGGFEFDRADGHDHWHFLQFARYRLLDEDRVSVMRSRKQSFCLAPTDAIDLLVPNAEWQPGELGFSRCGSATSLWIREVLPVGWGDTYYQWLGGQAFDVTDLPNGTYFIQVTANPQGLLYDVDASNDTRLRKVILLGEPGARRVRVPPWNQIDSEGTRPQA
jgi:hypothetical protein